MQVIDNYLETIQEVDTEVIYTSESDGNRGIIKVYYFTVCLSSLIYNFCTYNRLLVSLDTFSSSVPLSSNATNNREVYTLDNFAIQVQHVEHNFFKGEAFSVNLGTVEEAINRTNEIDGHNDGGAVQCNCFPSSTIHNI